MTLTIKDQFFVQIGIEGDKKKVRKRRSFLEKQHLNPFRKKSLYAFAKDCFSKEYLMEETPEERAAIDALINRIHSGELKDARKIICAVPLIACYRPLNQTIIADKVLEFAQQITYARYRELVKYAVEDPRKENLIKETINTLGTIEDDVSKSVKNQYEENPYPRWEGATGKRKQVKKTPPVSQEALTILSAGCGTGLQAVKNALAYPNATIYAVDLSKSSLAYAIRKSEELGIKNIKFFCGDILEIDKLGIEFDHILVTGVLHHMKDPVAGWRKLKEILKPGGTMVVGLYSELARQGILLTRAYIAAQNMSFNLENLQAVRNYVKNLPDNDIRKSIMLYGDFYSTSECRDMLFHVQEHNYTIPQIKAILEDLNMEFLHFQGSNKRVRAFYLKYPSKEDQKNLDLWHQFEQENPLTFMEMYVFNCKKPL